MRDNREGICVVDNDEAVDTFSRGTMTDKFGHGLPDTVDAAVLLRREPEYPFGVRDGDAMLVVVGG